MVAFRPAAEGRARGKGSQDLGSRRSALREVREPSAS